MKYLFSNVVFTPGEEVELVVDDQVKVLPKKLVALLQYFLDTNEQVSDNQQILAAVWGEGDHSFDAVRTAVYKLNQVLPKDAKIKNQRMKGYVLNVDLQKIETQYSKTELIVEKSPFVKNMTIAVVACLFLFAVAGLGSWAGAGRWIDPPPVYSVENVEPVFTRDHLVSLPQLAPGGDYIAYRLSNKIFEDDHLGLIDLTSGEERLLAKLRFDDGFKWDLTGNKIVYQSRTKSSCQIRLLLFDSEKEVVDDSLLTPCLVKSGRLSFAWFNDHEFYVNLIESERPGLPLHHLYSFDTRSKQSTKLITAKDEPGIGYFSLRFDESTNSLYMLKTHNFVKTDFYRYRDSKLVNLARLDFEVKRFSIANDQLIYKNDKNEFVININASDFEHPQVLLPSPMMPIAEPDYNGDKFTFVAGHVYGLALHKLTGNQLSKIELAGFSPSVLANYKESLVFVSDQTGTQQIYQQKDNGEAVQISKNQLSGRIKYINVAGDIFAVSYYDKVEFYQYQNSKLKLVNAVSGYTNGFLSATGDTVLLSTAVDRKATGELVEMRLSDLQSQPLNIKHTVLAAYHEGDIIYIDLQRRLYRITGGTEELVADNIDVRSFEQALVQQNRLYYIATKDGQNRLFTYDLVTNELSSVKLEGARPTRMIVIKDEIFIRIVEVLRPKMMIGNVTKK